jgi:hypothetical protein
MSSIKTLRESLENFETSTATTIESLIERIRNLENPELIENPEQLTEGPFAIVIKKIEETGKVITTANELAVNGLKNDISEVKNDILEVRNVIIQRLTDDNINLRDRVTLLEERLVANERRTNLMDQHSRKVNMEIDGIPDAVEHTQLKSFAAKIFREAGVEEVTEDDIEVIHRLPSKQKPKTTILKTKRDVIEKIMVKKKEIRDVGHTVMGLGENVKFYIKANLCPAFKSLAYNCRVLKKREMITDTWSNDGVIKIKLANNDYKFITHEYDLVKLFPDFEHFSFAKSFYTNILPDEDDDDDDV